MIEIAYLYFLQALSSAPVNNYWEDFKWKSVEINGRKINKAAILVPVRLGEYQCKTQLDTALGVSVIYRPGLPKKYTFGSIENHIKFNDFYFAGIKYLKEFTLMYPPLPASKRGECGAPELEGTIGSIGSDLLIGGNLTLDLDREKFLYAPGPYVENTGAVKQVINFSFVDLGDGDIPVISIYIDSVGLKKFVVDTGSASMAMNIYDKKVWKKVVGLNNVKNATPYKITRWGKYINCYSASSVRGMNADSYKIPEKLKVDYCDDSRGWQGQGEISGVVGLNFFKNNIITFDYFSKKLIF